MARKKQTSNPIGWVILGLMAFGIYQFGVFGDGSGERRTNTASKPVQPAATSQSSARLAPLNVPRFVNVASLNVRHAPSTSAELIMELPRGTSLRVIDRQNGWLLVDLNPTLEGWVSESLTTTEVLQQSYLPPAQLTGSR